MQPRGEHRRCVPPHDDPTRDLLVEAAAVVRMVMRIVSLLPSATEIVCAVGAQQQLVEISHECDFPPSVPGLPALTRSRIDPAGTSREIDAAVRETIRDALSIYAVDDLALGTIESDVIVTQDLCEVCAVSLDDVRAAVSRLAHRESVQIVSLRPTRLVDVLDDIERVASVLGLAPAGRELRRVLEGRIREISVRAEQAKSRLRVASLEWIDPPMLGGTWMPDLIKLAGGIAVGVEPGALAPTIEAADLARLAPDVIVAKPCGFTLDRALVESDRIAALARHVPAARVYVTDGNAYFNRPGPRLVESLEIMAACLHPDLFPDFAHAHAASIVTL